MFGLFRPRRAPAGPVEFSLAIDIACPAEDVFALVDWADPRNAKRQLGYAVTETAPGRFHMVIPRMGDVAFDLVETEVRPGEVYAFDARMTPLVGRLVHSHERYSFESTGEGTCRMTLVNTAQFVEGMRMGEFREEVGRMAASTQSALEKYKIQAEHGLGALRAVEDRLVL